MSLGSFDVKLPNAYRSTDFKTFEGLAKMVLSVCKQDINDITVLNNADRCPEHFLPFLCSKIGMPYFKNAIPYVNRQMLKLWRWMIKHKGTEDAMRLMTSFALMSFSKSQEEVKTILYYANSVDLYVRTFKNMYNPLDGGTKYIHIRPYIEIFYESIPGIEEEVIENRIMEFIDYVRPASWRIRFQPAIINREGGEGRGLVIDSRQKRITQSPETYTVGHSYVRDSEDPNRKESGVDFSEVWDKNSEN